MWLLRFSKVDGGVTANELCMQLQSDILGVPVSRPVVAETTALGAAYAAGLAVGFWSSTDELRANWAQGKRWSPRGRTTSAPSGMPGGARPSTAPWTGWRSTDDLVLAARRSALSRFADGHELDVLVVGGGVVGCGAALDAVTRGCRPG